MTSKSLALATVLLATAPGCIIAFDGTRGSGHAVTEERDTERFSSVQVDGLAKATVVVGANTRVRVRGDDNLVSFVRTRVVGDTLHVEVDGILAMPEVPLEVLVYTPTLEALDVNGAVSAEVTGLDGNTLDLTADGASHVELDGRVRCFTANLNGASILDGEEFQTECADVTADGASSIELGVNDTLRLDLDGASSLRVFGQPRILSQRVDGASSLQIGLR